MSGRIRTVKPEWLDDERLALASTEARVLSIGLVLLADDYGNGRANHILLSGRVFPGKPLDTLAKALGELESLSYVTLYEVDGQSYFHIRNWEKHQKVDKPGKPRVPPPSGSFEKVREEEEKVPAPRGSYVPGPDRDPEQPAGARAAVGAAGLGMAMARNRADVRDVHAAWMQSFNRKGSRLGTSWNDTEADVLAARIDANGLADCLLVAKHAPNDGMVSGRDDKGKKHESIRYIFGNDDAFSRILRDAVRAERKDSGLTPTEKIRRAGELR